MGYQGTLFQNQKIEMFGMVIAFSNLQISKKKQGTFFLSKHNGIPRIFIWKSDTWIYLGNCIYLFGLLSDRHYI